LFRWLVFKGFENAEPVYTPYPDALINMRYITSVGKIILKGNDAKSLLDFEKPNRLPAETYDFRVDSKSAGAKVHDVSPILWHAVDLYMTTIERFNENAIEDATFSLIECSLKLNEDHWQVELEESLKIQYLNNPFFL
jgi:hypothetical protein